MKILLSTLNSKYIHSNLAIRYLKEYVRDLIKVDIEEYTINQRVDEIAADIYRKSPDLLGFSVYIWNIDEILSISQIIKMVSPNTKILLGGPEVSFDGAEVLSENPFIDYIIYGEGEETFKDLILNKDMDDIEGLIYRYGSEIKVNRPRKLLEDLDSIPSPYENIGEEFKNKIVYYESSRGCPFNCEFCLSSTIKGVRYFSMERVKKDIMNLIQGGVSQVKFVDRTFNANRKYSREIMNYIMEMNPEGINFHFEVTAHLINQEDLEFLKNPKEGLFQFEIGVQSTNDDTINAIGRTTDFEKLKTVVKQIKENKNIHQHLDLIAGLPYETYESFRNSFNDVYDIRPEKLQLGFLKLLKGSQLRLKEVKYGYKYLNSPPYEVLKSNFISYEDILRLKGVEELVERYYNEEYFKHSLEFAIRNNFSSAFDFYESFSDYWLDMELYKASHSRNSLYGIFWDYYSYKGFNFQEDFKSLLKYDYIANNQKNNYPFAAGGSEIRLNQSIIHQILNMSEIRNKYLSHYEDIPTKKLINMVMIEPFSKNVFKIIEDGYIHRELNDDIYILFDYRNSSLNRYMTYEITDYIKELIG